MSLGAWTRTLFHQEPIIAWSFLLGGVGAWGARMGLAGRPEGLRRCQTHRTAGRLCPP